jgi:SMODS-associating 4TM effector domain
MEILKRRLNGGNLFMTINSLPITVEKQMITTKQNTEKQLQRLGAQRQLYATAKTILGWQLFVGCPIAAISAIVVIVEPSLKGLVASWGLLVTLANLFWLTPWQKRIQDSAARIQETFDCDVLGLTWNELKAGKHPDPELIKEQYDKYKKWESRMPPLTNWYPSVVEDLPIHIGRITCQRSNCWWDANQRKRFAVSAIAIVVVIFIVVFLLSLVAGITVEDFIIKIVAPLLPAVVIAIQQYREHTDAATRMTRLKDHADKLWKDALLGKSKTALLKESRILQDEILENRRKNPPVFDFIFKRIRPNFEVQMNYAAEELAEQAKQSKY